MDRIIEKAKPNYIKTGIYVAIVFAVTFAMFRLVFIDFDMPSVDQEKIRTGTVKRGALDILISGSGIVIAKDPEWIVSKASGQVIKSIFKSGESVKKGDVIIELANEDIISAYLKSESELKAIKADYLSLKVNLDLQRVGYESDLRKAELDNRQAGSFYIAVKSLWEKDNPPISKLEYIKISLKAEQTKGLVEAAKKKLESFGKIEAAQLEAFKFRLTAVEEENARLKSRMADLKIAANTDGIIQNLSLKTGQGVKVGESIAQVINPSATYITLKMPAMQAFKLSIMQKVNIELNRKIIRGVVHRIDPNVKGTTVDVDVDFDEEVKDVKIGMFVNGTVFIQSIADTLYVEMPSHAYENDSMSTFLVSPDGKYANIVTIKTGALSSNYLQIVSGLKEGDKIILSDVPVSNDVNKLRLN